MTKTHYSQHSDKEYFAGSRARFWCGAFGRSGYTPDWKRVTCKRCLRHNRDPKHELRLLRKQMNRLLDAAEGALFWWRPSAKKDARNYSRADYNMLRQVVTDCRQYKLASRSRKS